MKVDRRLAGLALIAAAAIIVIGIAGAQPVPVPTVPPPAVPPPGTAPVVLPSLPEGSPPLLPIETHTPPAQGTPVIVAPAAGAPAGGPDAGIPINDLIVDLTQGPTASNPTGRQEPGVSLEWLYPATVRLGQPVTCTLIVKSLSVNRLHQVAVRYRVPAGLTVRGAEPKASEVGDILIWQLGNLEPRQEKRIDVNLLPTAKGLLPCHAFVTFTGSTTARLDVREPKLALKTTAPSKSLTGDLTTFAVTISNPGDAKVDHVKVRVALSDGLEYGTGKSTEFNLEGVGAGESRTVLVQCVAKVTGTQSCSVQASADPGLEATSGATVEVVAPKIDVAVSAPKMRYLDRHALITFKVTNPGTAMANHVSLHDVVPAGFKVVEASDGAHHDFATRTVAWYLGDLDAGKSKEVTLDLLAINPGEFKNQVIVTAVRGLRAVTDVFTRVEGLPGLQMELVDLEDPVEQGKEMSYEIRLSNTGTKTETNLQLVCTMPDRMEFVGAKSSVGVPVKAEGRDIIFAVIPKLAPRADIIFRVNCRSLVPGDVRFQARIRADGLESPVLREESTRVFGDDRDGAGVPKR